MLAGLAPTQLPPFRGGGREHVGERWSACLRRLLSHSAPMTCFPLRASNTCRRTGVRLRKRDITNTPQHDTQIGRRANAMISVTARRMRSYRAPRCRLKYRHRCHRTSPR